MAFPGPFQNDPNVNNLHTYQGILIVEVVLTLVLYTILRIIHYVKWGYDEELPDNPDKADPKVEEEEGSSKKWDMKTWNIYFPIIFSQHIGAIALIIIYIPYVYSAVIGFLHFAAFVTLIILNICVKDADPLQGGSRTKGSRVVWGFMGLLNLMLIIGGLSGVAKVYL